MAEPRPKRPGRHRSAKPRFPSGRVKPGAEPRKAPPDAQAERDQDWWLEQAMKHGSLD